MPYVMTLMRNNPGELAGDIFERFTRAHYYGNTGVDNMYDYYTPPKEPWNLKESQLTKCLELMAKYPSIYEKLGVSLVDMLDKDNHFLEVIDVYMQAEQSAREAAIAYWKRNPEAYKKEIMSLNN